MLERLLIPTHGEPLRDGLPSVSYGSSSSSTAPDDPRCSLSNFTTCYFSLIQTQVFCCGVGTRYVGMQRVQQKGMRGQTVLTLSFLWVGGATCSSVVRASVNSAMGRWIDPSWWTHWAISRSSLCLTTGIYVVMSVEWYVYIFLKKIAANGIENPLCRQRGSSLAIRAVLYHITEAV